MIQLDSSAHTRALSLYHHMCHSERRRRRQPKTEEKKITTSTIHERSRDVSHTILACSFITPCSIVPLLSHPSISFALYVHKIRAHNGEKWMRSTIPFVECFGWWKSITFSHFALITLKDIAWMYMGSYAHSCLLASVSAYFIQQSNSIASEKRKCIGFKENTIK